MKEIPQSKINSSQTSCLMFTKASLPNYSRIGPQATAQNYSVWGSNRGFDVEPLIQDNANDIYLQFFPPLMNSTSGSIKARGI